jgi:hypothetical protein
MRMRITMSLTAGLLVASFAQASGAAGRTTITGYGPYVFGMSPPAVLQVDPAWRLIAPHTGVVKGQPAMWLTKTETIALGPTIAAVRGELKLLFIRGRLVQIILWLRGPAVPDPAFARIGIHDSLYDAAAREVKDTYSPSIIDAEISPGAGRVEPALLLADGGGNTLSVMAFSQPIVNVVYQSAAWHQITDKPL